MNMRSAADDLTARAAIRHRALELFAERGPDAVSVRDIATAAGVSPALVLHHYGSKAGLVAAVNEHVAGMFDEALTAMAERPDELTSGPAAAGGAADLMLSTFPAGSPVPAYLRRLLLSGDPVGRTLFAHWYHASAAVLGGLAEQGLLRPTDDPAVRAAFLLVNDLALVLLRDHLTDVLGVDPLTPAGMQRWAAVALAAYSQGVFTTEEDRS
jgi:AcrR family transcriptional regulator